MCAMIRPDVSTGQEPSGPTIEPGQLITLVVDGNPVQCVVARLQEGEAVLLPLSDEVFDACDLEEASLQIETDGGVAKFSFECGKSIPVIQGKISEVRAVVDRRQYFRIRVELKVELSVDGKTWFEGASKDISEGGTLLVLMGERPPVSSSQNVFIRLHLPDSSVVAANGIVKRMRMASAGSNRKDRIVVQFTGMPPKARQALVQYIYRYQVEHASYR